MKSLLLTFILGLTLSVQAVTYYFPSNPPPVVQLAWGASPSTTNGPLFYKVYYGPGHRTYTNVVNVSTNLTTTISNLVRGSTYYFSATASTSDGLESEFSNEVSWTPAAPPTAPTMGPPVILTVQMATTPKGQFADAGMDWTLSPEQAQQYFRLRMDRAPAVAVNLTEARKRVRSKPIVFPPLPPPLVR